ncbi:hypothetical protein Btru_074810 [Bulinus truncatus]|nr:hypothetical protein Btru_074810 [Bulinus truncatus]
MVSAGHWVTWGQKIDKKNDESCDTSDQWLSVWFSGTQKCKFATHFCVVGCYEMWTRIKFCMRVDKSAATGGVDMGRSEVAPDRRGQKVGG